jgi:signal transduction histidine kinase
VALQPRFAWSLALGCVLWQLVARIGSMSDIMTHLSMWSLTTVIIGAFAIAGLVGTQVAVTLRRGHQIALLGFLVALTFAPFVVVGPAWAHVAGILGAAVLLSFRAPASWILFGLVMTANAVVLMAVYPSGENLWLFVHRMTMAALIVGLTLFAVARLAWLIQEAADSRERVAQAEVNAERLRASNQLRTEVGAQLAGLLRRIREQLAASTLSRRELSGVATLGQQACHNARNVIDVHRSAIQPQFTDDRSPPPSDVVNRFSWWVSLLLVIGYSGLAINNLAWSEGIGARTWAVVIATVIVN